MTLPVSSLANMEYMLYGGVSGANPYCPSYANGYQGSTGYYPGVSNYYNPYQNYYNNGANNTSSASYTNNTGVSSQQTNNVVTTDTTVQQPVVNNKNAVDTLAKYYEDTKGKEIVQTWGGLGISAAMIAATENAQNMKHFINASTAIKTTNKVFDKSNAIVKELWTKNPELAQKAYGQLHAINRMSKSKWPIIGGWFQKSIDEGTRKQLEKIMADAVKSGDEKAILRATETLKAARGKDGYIVSAWNKINNFFGGKAKNYTPMERIANKADAIEKAVNAPAALKPGLKGLLKQGLKEGKMFALFGLLIDAPKLISSYQNGGTDSVVKQISQTGVRALADGVGWTLGRAAGTALGTKAGAAIGTALCPGIGTAVGAALGFIGGAAGSILASKLCHKIIPVDEATKLEAEKLKKTPEGQQQLLSLVTQKAQMGENIPQNVIFAANNIYAN